MKSYFIIFVLNIGLLNAQWTLQNSNVNEILWDVCFIDTLHGWAIGENSTIINTTNGGDTWNIQTCPIDSIKLEEVCFVNDTAGYIVGRDATILATNDGGLNWTSQTSPVNYPLFDVTFVNEDTGWIAGSDIYLTRKHGVILHTTNGGQTWEIQFEIHSPGIFGSKLFRGVRFLDDQNGWAIAGDYVDNFSSTYIYHTSNGGSNWNINGVASTPFFQMSTVSLDTLWGCGFGFGSSYDSGINWIFNAILGGNVLDIAQINGSEGWVSAGHISDKGVFYTQDGGINWDDMLAPDSISIIAISNIGSNTFWGVGQPGIVLKYRKQPSVIKKDYDPIPFQSSLSQNHPNPFNPTTIIKYTLSKSIKVTIEVFNLLGQKIEALINKQMSVGSHEIEFTGKNLSSGVYLYRIEAGEFQEIKKMILLR
jgi:photosystem II stability/assembly factor-like uncharacterized protein